MSLSPHVALHWLGVGLGMLIVLGTVPTLLFPAPKKSAFHFTQMFTDALRSTWRASKSKECLTGFALFLAPASAEAAINLFSGMGKDFHTNEGTVVWVTGAGCAVSASLGALLGGSMANRVSRGYLYLLSGMGGGLCAFVLAFCSHTSATFISGTLIYNGATGVVYAAFNALGYQLVGQRNVVASTQLGLFSAATNAAIVYMTWVDGQGYKHFGMRGLLLTDSIASIASGALLLYFLRSRLKKPSSDMNSPVVPETDLA